MPPTAVTIVSGAVRDVIQFVPVPALGACCATLAAVIAICHELRSQKRQATELCELCRKILAAINAKIYANPGLRATPLPEGSPLAANIHKLAGDLDAIKSDLEAMRNLSFIKRLVKKENHADILSGHMNRLTWAVEIFQIENNIDIAASLESDRRAKQEDSAHFEELLETIISNDQRLEDSLQLRFDDTQSRLAEIHNMLLFATRQKTECPPGRERRFYELSHSKLVSMSGGLEPPTAPWVISSLDVECYEVIGRGANSTVYRGKWNNEEVAVKRLLDGVSEKTFMDEAALWANLSNHLRIHRFLRACISPKLIVSAYHHHGDVTKYLRSHPDADRVALIRDIAVGMNFLHKNRGLHGDLKASNVLVDEGGKACISDFGLSKVRQESETITLGHPKNGEAPITGTMRWMSPERLSQGPLDTKVDVYAFAMTCYEIFSGDIPFSAFGNIDAYDLVVEKRLRPARPASSALSDAVWDLVTQCWAQDPALRPSFSSIVSRFEVIINRPPPRTHISRQSNPTSDSSGRDQATDSSSTTTTTTTASPTSSTGSQTNTPTYSAPTPATSITSLSTTLSSHSVLKPTSVPVGSGSPSVSAAEGFPMDSSLTTGTGSAQTQPANTPRMMPTYHAGDMPMPVSSPAIPVSLSGASLPAASHPPESRSTQTQDIGGPLRPPNDLINRSNNEFLLNENHPEDRLASSEPVNSHVHPDQANSTAQRVRDDLYNIPDSAFAAFSKSPLVPGTRWTSGATPDSSYGDTVRQSETARFERDSSTPMTSVSSVAVSNHAIHPSSQHAETSLTDATGFSLASSQNKSHLTFGSSSAHKTFGFSAQEERSRAAELPAHTTHTPVADLGFAHIKHPPSTPRPVQSPLQQEVPLPALYVAPPTLPAEKPISRPVVDHADTEPALSKPSHPAQTVRGSTFPAELPTVATVTAEDVAKNIELQFPSKDRNESRQSVRDNRVHSASNDLQPSNSATSSNMQYSDVQVDAPDKWLSSQQQDSSRESLSVHSSSNLQDVGQRTILEILSPKKLSYNGEWPGEYDTLVNYLRHESIAIRDAALNVIFEMVERAEAHPPSNVIQSLMAATILAALGPDECHVTVNDASARTWCKIVEDLAQDPAACREILHDKDSMELIWACTSHESLSQHGWEILRQLSGSSSKTNKALFENTLTRMNDPSFDLSQLHIQVLSNCAKSCEERHLLGHIKHGLIDIFVRAVELSRTAATDSTDDAHGAHGRRLLALISLRDISAKSPAICDAMVLTPGFRSLPTVLRDDLAMRQRQSVIDLLRNVIQGTKEEGEAFESLVDSENGISPLLVSSIRPAENARVALSAWDALNGLFDKLALYDNRRSWALRKQVGRNAGLQERLRDALSSPTVEVARSACDVAAGLVSVPEGAAKEQAARALHDVAVMMIDNHLCARLVELLKDRDTKLQPAAMKAITKIGLCLGATKDERKAVLDLLSPLKKPLREAKDSEISSAASAMFAELDPPGKMRWF